ncbi:MAG TPA: DNA mismatch repair endonuclease MutL, partial [Pyrinomonadaceae bacterium]|nr:DNA mismatch repair endonuclease MutL [Pyrinomonadaceae bacterium]
DDAVLAFERHATSKINTTADLDRIGTLGFRGEALASIASVARVELVTQRAGEAEGTRVLIEGGRMRDVAPAARPRGTTVAARDLFFNVPARRKFLRSEATENYHLTNLVTHYALAHPEIAFTLTSNGREILRAAPAADLRERAYQIFGAEFVESLLEVVGGHARVARVRGYVSAPRERRTTRDAQFLFVNGRYVRDRVMTRALSEGFRSVLPQGAFPAALLFLDVPPEEVDVNVHPAKTEVRFRRTSAIADAVRDAVRAALAAAGYLRATEDPDARDDEAHAAADDNTGGHGTARAHDFSHDPPAASPTESGDPFRRTSTETFGGEGGLASRAGSEAARQESIEFGSPATDDSLWRDGDAAAGQSHRPGDAATEAPTPTFDAVGLEDTTPPRGSHSHGTSPSIGDASSTGPAHLPAPRAAGGALPPLGSAAGLVREASAESLSADIRPLGQLGDTYVIAADAEGLLLIDQHLAHERILFDKYRLLESGRAPESQNLLVPETFDLTPAQAAVFDSVSEELERYGFSLMRLSGRTVAVRAVPADLPAGEARNLLADIVGTTDSARRVRARDALREEIAASLASRAAIKGNTPLTPDKMRWLIDRLLRTSSPTTSPNGRPVILRLARRDIERGFHRP